MTFSQYAGTAIIPTLSRLVLCLAFVSAGWNKVFKEDAYNAQEAARLESMGVTMTPVVKGAAMRLAPLSPAQEDAGMKADERQMVLASYRQDAAGTQSAPAATEPAASSSASKPSGGAKTPAEGQYKALKMYRIALLLDGAGWKYPVWLARLAAVTELVGGGMLLIGLFSRFWAMGLAIAMGVAFYLTTVQMNDVLHTWPMTFAENIGNFNTMYCQLGLLLLALGIFLTGPGPLSVDRILFAKDPAVPPPLEEAPKAA